MSYLSNNLKYYARSLSGFRRRGMKVLPLATNSATFGSQITFNLPSNSLIDLDTLQLHFNAVCDNTGAGVQKQLPVIYIVWIYILVNWKG